jgi:hypothetical protein
MLELRRSPHKTDDNWNYVLPDAVSKAGTLSQIGENRQKIDSYQHERHLWSSTQNCRSHAPFSTFIEELMPLLTN